MMERLVINSDITVVGAGIAGLWAAKEFIDEGLLVNVVEQAPLLATGQTTKNEGWLHAGTYHAAAMDTEEFAMSVAAKVRYGHKAILDFAPDAIEHSTSYALLAEEEMTDHAVQRWQIAHVPFAEVNKVHAAEDGVNTSRLHAVFAVEDKSIDTVRLCEKLADYVVEQGGKIFTHATFRPDGEGTADLDIEDNRRYRLESDQFLITAGNGTKEIAEMVIDGNFPMRFFKSHLLVFPRITEHNYFHIEGGETGFMNHGRVSVAGLNRDSIEMSTPDHEVDDEKVLLLHDALVRIVPKVARYHRSWPQIIGVACVKPDIERGHEQPGLDEEIIQLTPSYTIALPGKMTEAPHLARSIVENVINETGLSAKSRSFKSNDIPQIPYSVHPRSADLGK